MTTTGARMKVKTKMKLHGISAILCFTAAVGILFGLYPGLLFVGFWVVIGCTHLSIFKRLSKLSEFQNEGVKRE